jgi:hypothetical protein
MLVRDLRQFTKWLVSPVEISANELSFLDEKNFLELRSKLPHLTLQNSRARRPSVDIGNFTITETYSVPQILVRIFSDRQNFLNFALFLNTLKFKVTNVGKEIVNYVLNLDSIEKNLNVLFNFFKKRQKLQEKEILLQPLKKNEEFENLRLNSIRKKEQDKPVGMSIKINEMIREMSKNVFLNERTKLILKNRNKGKRVPKKEHPTVRSRLKSGSHSKL